jgi:hypothetical protein
VSFRILRRRVRSQNIFQPTKHEPTSISDKLDVAASVTSKKGAVRNHAKLFQPRLAFMRQRRESCYQCRLSSNLDSNIWKGLRKGKVEQGYYRPELGRLGPPHLDVHPLPAARLMMGKDALFSRVTSSKTIRYSFWKNAALGPPYCANCLHGLSTIIYKFAHFRHSSSKECIVVQGPSKRMHIPNNAQ